MTMKKFIKRNIMEIYVLSLILTVLGIQTAYEWRGYFAAGGEVFIPILPVILHIWASEED